VTEKAVRRRYVTADVFTNRMFGGNPLAVVLDAGAAVIGTHIGGRCVPVLEGTFTLAPGR
jgi:hypothetical protein